MLELVGVDHGADRLDQAVGDVEGEHADHPAVGVVDHRAGLAVDHGRLAVGALLAAPAEQPEQEPGDAVRPVRRIAQRPPLASAVADHDHVGGEKLQQALEVASPGRVEEAAGHLVALLA
jgi:hypothetical protein